jgi:hypothetical protein
VGEVEAAHRRAAEGRAHLRVSHTPETCPSNYDPLSRGQIHWDPGDPNTSIHVCKEVYDSEDRWTHSNKISCLDMCRYLKFQATHKLTRFFEGWAKRHIAGRHYPSTTHIQILFLHIHIDIRC